MKGMRHSISVQSLQSRDDNIVGQGSGDGVDRRDGEAEPIETNDRINVGAGGNGGSLGDTRVLFWETD
jgi:hypothetical protein